MTAGAASGPRLLLWGLQGSGASTVAMLLAQWRACLALIDLPHGETMPSFDGVMAPILAKAVVTTTHPLRSHQERLQPDATIAVVRDPVRTLRSMRANHRADLDGTIAEKFAALEAALTSRHAIDRVIHYEAFAADPVGSCAALRDLGWPVDAAWTRFDRSYEAILADLHHRAPAVFFGTVHSGGARRGDHVMPALAERPEPTAEEAAFLAAACPVLWRTFAGPTPPPAGAGAGKAAAALAPAPAAHLPVPTPAR